jgi:uncharacterized protein YfiM (DUF2279 family)
MTAGVFILLFLSPSNFEVMRGPQYMPDALFPDAIYAGNTAEPPRLLDDFDNEPKSDEDAWIGMDKFWHWALAFTLTGSTYHLMHNQLNTDDPCAAIISVSSTLGFSILKEFYDLATYGLFSFKDLAYDILGISTGYIVFILDWQAL